MNATPSVEEVRRYSEELNSAVDPEKFFNYYSKTDWTIGGDPINDWKALFRSWDKREPKKTENKQTTKERYWWHPKMAGMDDPQFVADLEAFMRE